MENYGITTSILRFTNIYGLGFPYKQSITIVHKFLLQALLNQTLTVYGGSQERDFVNVHDVCNAIDYCLNDIVEGTRYVGSGQLISILDFAKLIRQIFHDLYGRDVTIAVIEKELSEEQYEVPDEHMNWNWKPRITLEEGIKQILNQLN